jgi:putative salt-induced outer membrane protein YdiY
MRTNIIKTNRHLVAIAVAILAVGCGLTHAQTPATVTAPKTNSWEGDVNAGLTLTRGNSDSVLFVLGGNAKKKWDQNEFALGAAAGYGQSDNVNNNEFAQGYAQYNRLFTDRFYGGLRLDANYDGIAKLSYRFTVTPLVGYYLIKGTNTTLAVEAGPSLVTEKYFYETPDTYCGLRFGEKYDQKLTETTKIWEYASYTPQVDRWQENYVVTIEAGIDTAISKQWGLRVVLQDIYTSEPAAGSVYNELRLIAGTRYKF